MIASSPARSSLWIPVLLGAILFVALGGLSVLLPSSIGWLMRGLLDPPSHQLGWEFFRETPFLQFPLGANPRYGMEMGSSIVFSDSLPLFALPFKLLGPLLPDTFQYFGLWVFTCMLLQGIFGYLVLSRFTANRWLLGLGTALLLLLPPYLMRFTIHLALGGQWLLLAGLYLYFDPTYRTRFWLLMLAMATLTHAYLLVMLAAIWGADLLQRLLSRQLTLSQCIWRGLTGSAVVLAIMWCLGYFMLGSSPAAPGQYGRMNLLSLIDSRGSWSRIFPGSQLTQNFLDGDGFAYMGVGMLGLLAVACVLAATSKRGSRPSSSTTWPLAIMAVLMLLISLTNTVSLGNYILLQFELPEWATRLYQIFRSPGRMFWPAFYLLSVVAITVVCTRLRPRAATSMLAIALCIQIYDLSGVLQGMRSFFRQEPGWATPFVSPLWDQLGPRYNKVLYVTPMNVPADFIPLSDFARRHGMSINSGNFARIDGTAETRARAILAEQVRTGDYDPKAIYVFNDSELWDVATRTLSGNDQAGVLNGIKLVLPGLGQCQSCPLADFETQRWGTWPARQLPTLVGQLQDDALLAPPGTSGYLSYGPYTRIPAGRYRYRIIYRASAAPETIVGHWDIVSAATTTPVMLANGQLTGTNDEVQAIEGVLQRTEDSPSSEIRTFANGNAALVLLRIELSPEHSAATGDLQPSAAHP